MSFHATFLSNLNYRTLRVSVKKINKDWKKAHTFWYSPFTSVGWISLSNYATYVAYILKKQL